MFLRKSRQIVLGVFILGLISFLAFWVKEDEIRKGFLNGIMALEKEEKNKGFSPDKKEELVLLTVYDNYKTEPHLETGWGFSCLVYYGSQTILFDTGADSRALLSNMEKLSIDIAQIDFVFISHLHHDHTGGLVGILDKKPDLKVYKPSSFSTPAEIKKNIYTTGPLGSQIKEQSLIIKTKQGLVIITGCAHPGVVNIIKKAKEVFPKESIYLVLGGFHLSSVSTPQLEEIIKDFQRLGVQKVAPCHCSGDKTRQLFEREYNDNFIGNGAGKIIKI